MDTAAGSHTSIHHPTKVYWTLPAINVPQKLDFAITRTWSPTTNQRRSSIEAARPGSTAATSTTTSAATRRLRRHAHASPSASPSPSCRRLPTLTARPIAASGLCTNVYALTTGRTTALPQRAPRSLRPTNADRAATTIRGRTPLRPKQRRQRLPLRASHHPRRPPARLDNGHC